MTQYLMNYQYSLRALKVKTTSLSAKHESRQEMKVRKNVKIIAEK